VIVSFARSFIAAWRGWEFVDAGERKYPWFGVTPHHSPQIGDGRSEDGTHAFHANP
jgi:hypothetical protein